MASLTAAKINQAKLTSLPPITRQSASVSVTVFFAYIFVGLTIQVGLLTQLGVNAQDASSWFFITWMTTSLFSLCLSLFTK
jgi:hypothetical protein